MSKTLLLVDCISVPRSEMCTILLGFFTNQYGAKDTKMLNSFCYCLVLTTVLCFSKNFLTCLTAQCCNYVGTSSLICTANR